MLLPRSAAHQARALPCRCLACSPQDSGRNAFRRAWAKQLQIKWDAQRKAAERAAARKRKHAAQLEKYKQRRAAGEAAAA